MTRTQALATVRSMMPVDRGTDTTDRMHGESLRFFDWTSRGRYVRLDYYRGVRPTV